MRAWLCDPCGTKAIARGQHKPLIKSRYVWKDHKQETRNGECDFCKKQGTLTLYPELKKERNKE